MRAKITHSEQQTAAGAIAMVRARVGAITALCLGSSSWIRNTSVLVGRNGMGSRHCTRTSTLQLGSAPLPHEDDAALRKRPNKRVQELNLELEPTINRDREMHVSLGEGMLKAFKEEAPPMSIFLLNLVAVIWGTQHAVIKMVMDDSQAAPFTLLRFSIAAILASPYTPGVFDSNSNEDSTRGAWRWGLEMGFWMFLGFSFQAIGLGYTSAQRSGFLIYLNVKLVPFFARILFGRPISIPTWLSATAAFVGTALLALDGESIGLNVGDIWTLAAASSSAMFILRLEEATLQIEDSASLNSACLWAVFILSFLWTFGTSGLSVDDILLTTQGIYTIACCHPFELLYLGGVTTALSNFIQTKAQKDVSAERASVIYSLDPVYGALFSYWLLGEELGGIQAYLGAALITVAAATNVFLDLGKKNHSKIATGKDGSGVS